MQIKGALHVHSNFSRDGTMTIAELAERCMARSYQFIAIEEHSQDRSEEKVEILKKQSAKHSCHAFCIIPDIEYSCKGGIHIFGLGALGLTPQTDPVVVAEEIRAHGGLAILAHPYRYNWTCAPELLKAVNNVGCDGKCPPLAQAPAGFRKLQQMDPRLWAVVGRDFDLPPDPIRDQRKTRC